MTFHLIILPIILINHTTDTFIAVHTCTIISFFLTNQSDKILNIYLLETVSEDEFIPAVRLSV